MISIKINEEQMNIKKIYSNSLENELMYIYIQGIFLLYFLRKMIVINISIETDSASSSNKSIGRSKFSAAHRTLWTARNDTRLKFAISPI